MRSQLVVGLWLVLGGSIGGTRAVLKYRRDNTGHLWVVEGILSVIAWGIGLILVVHAFAVWINQ